MLTGIEGIGTAAVSGLADTKIADSSYITDDGRTMAQVMADTVNGVSGISRENMTSAEYRDYILDRISSLPVDPSQAYASIAVHRKISAGSPLRELWEERAPMQ